MSSTDRDLLGMTEDQVTDYYERWKEWMLAITRRGGVMIGNSKWAPFHKHLLERLLEDPWWRHAVPSEVEPMLMFKDVVPEGSMFIWTAEKAVQTPRQFFGRTGFGRLNMATPSADGIQPWDTAHFDGTPAILIPDDPENPVVKERKEPTE